MVLNSYSVISEVLTVHLNLWAEEYVCAAPAITSERSLDCDIHRDTLVSFSLC